MSRGSSRRLGEALVADRRLEHHALVELGDHFALDLLPRRLALGIGVAVLLQRGAARRQLLVGNEDVGAALVEVDADAVAGAQQRQPAARRRLGRSVEDRRRARRAGLPAVADAGQGVDALA